jgi:hypothetical protein
VWIATAKAVQEWGFGLAVKHGDLDPGESGLVEEPATFARREAQPDVRIAFVGLTEAVAEPITEVVTAQKVAARELAQHAATDCRPTGGGPLRHSGRHRHLGLAPCPRTAARGARGLLFGQIGKQPPCGAQSGQGTRTFGCQTRLANWAAKGAGNRRSGDQSAMANTNWVTAPAHPPAGAAWK